MGETYQKLSIAYNMDDDIIGDIRYYRLTNSSGAEVTLSNLGAGVVALTAPDRAGRLADVVLGYRKPESYYADGAYMGKTPGRYANRIGLGRFSIKGKNYQLPVNNGPNCNHGGILGLANKIWDAETAGERSIRFSCLSPDGDEGFPGNLRASVTYTWDDDNTLEIVLEAKTDATTVINLTNHSYFNLDGEDSGSVLDHVLWLNSRRWLPTDAYLLPTGAVESVEGTPMDFTSPKSIGRDMGNGFTALLHGKGYDHCWLVDGHEPGVVQEVAVLSSAKSGRVLRVYSSQPAVQVYAGCWLGGSPESISGNRYRDYDGVAIECQGCPDAPNRPSFPSQVLNPGESYHRRIIFKFSTDNQ